MFKMLFILVLCRHGRSGDEAEEEGCELHLCFVLSLSKEGRRRASLYVSKMESAGRVL
jgi:hypothetical protein